MTDLLEAQIGDLLRTRKLKLATAESCTGGLIASRITDVPGSSDYFIGGVVSYAYEAKVSLL
ncbi:MAG TPA: CinA family protein, partial [Anaerolineales bacterium]